MHSLISKLEKRLTPNPKVAAIERGIMALFNPELPLTQQHHMKALWYRDRIDLVLRGRAQEVTPVNMELVPSLDCNFRCPHCTYNRWKGRTEGARGWRTMTYEEMVTLLDRLEEAGVQGLTVTGGGEPFQNLCTLRGLEYAAKKRFETGVFTNGSLLDKEIIVRLTQLNLRFVRISLNTADAESYLRFHGIQNPEILRRVQRNIALLGCGLYHSPTDFGLAAIVNEVNADSMESIAEFVRCLFDKERQFKLDYLSYRPVFNYGQIDSDMSVQIGDSVVRQAIASFERVQGILKDYPVKLFFARDYFAAASARAYGRLANGHAGCLGHGFCGSVAFDGGVYLCSERDGEPLYCMGNLLAAPLCEIWASEQRSSVLRNIRDCPPACKMYRTNLLLSLLTSQGTLDDRETNQLQSFFDVIRQAGAPDTLAFFSY